MEKRIVNTTQLAEFFGVDRTTIWKWRKKGLPTITAVGNAKFDLEEVLEWMKNN